MRRRVYMDNQKLHRDGGGKGDFYTPFIFITSVKINITVCLLEHWLGGTKTYHRGNFRVN